MPNRGIKAFCLLDIFREMTDESHRLSVPQLQVEMNDRGCLTERKAIYRDIERLREQGYAILSSTLGYYLDEREFTRSELRLLISAVQAAAFIGEADTEILMDKLCAHTSVYQAEALRAQANLSGNKYGSSQVMHTIERVNRAIAMGQQIRFFYYKRDVSKKSVIQRSGRSYCASPYAMIWVQDKYYLVASMEERDNLTHFRLDRMQDTELLTAPARPFSEVSEYQGRFDAADYARKCLNMFGGEVRGILLRCHTSLIDELVDRFGENTPIRAEEDGEYFTAHIRAAEGEGFYAWASQFGPRLEILSPADMRAVMAGRAEKTQALYAALD